jgi:hypothetical protein
MVEYSAFNRFVLGSSPRQPIYLIYRILKEFEVKRKKFISFILKNFIQLKKLNKIKTINQ